MKLNLVAIFWMLLASQTFGLLALQKWLLGLLHPLAMMLSLGFVYMVSTRWSNEEYIIPIAMSIVFFPIFCAIFQFFEKQ